MPMDEFDRRTAPPASGVPAIARDEDYCGWLAEQASLLRSDNYAALDSLNLAEELAATAASERRKVVSLLRVVLMHLLKWHYSKTRRSWKVSLITVRTDVADVLQDSRTLRNELPSLLAKAYQGARPVAGTEMRMAKHDWQRLFPAICPWTEPQVLDEDFFPEIAPGANGRS
jgi:Domain of unknown function DUF29